MWPFECREISTFREVWTLVIHFLEGNSKIGDREAVDQVPYCQYQLSVLSSTQKWRGRYTWSTFIGNCRKFKWSVTLTLTLDRVKVASTYTVHVGLPAAQPRDCSITQYRNMAIWMSSNIDIGRSLNSHDSFPRWKFKNRAPTSCSAGAMSSTPKWRRR